MLQETCSADVNSPVFGQDDKFEKSAMASRGKPPATCWKD